MMNISDSNLVASSKMGSRNIHVLLVEHESRDHDNITNLLNYFSYKVTSVKLASTASSILSRGKVEFDLVLVNINSPESLGVVQLLEDATKMKLLVIFMSNEADDAATVRALEQGAFLCTRKPLSMAIVGSLWQFVMSEKARRPKETEPLTKLMDYHNSQETKEFEKYILESNHNYINNTDYEEKQKSETSSNSENYRVGYKRKAWTEWTVDLHRKFMAAATYLGEGRCYPKDILEIMNVPGLTRMQVASHLQKCRNYKWLPPNERKSKVGNNREKKPKKPITNNPPRGKKMRFGLMPFGQTTIQEFQETTNHHQDFTINPPTQLDHGLYPFAADNMGLDEAFLHGDYHHSLAPNPNFLHNINITKDPLELLPIALDSSDKVHDLPDFQQQLEMDFDAEWEAFIFDGEEHNQVSAVAGANNQWFSENEGTEMIEEGWLNI